MNKFSTSLIILLFSLSLFVLTSCMDEEILADAAHTYKIWLANSEDSSYYSDYNENVALKYLNTLKFKGRDGKLHHVHIEVETGITGEQEKFFNTMIATGGWKEYDYIDYSFSSYSVTELYEAGIALDLTDYMEEWLPNYMNWLQANPDYARTAANIVNGERRYLTLYSYHDDVENWGGFVYRRDWVLKYGKHPEGSPKAGQPFTGGFDENGTWNDDITFPSYYTELGQIYKENIDPEWDGTCPVFISDWEWMLDIFSTALKEEGITDGYCTTIYYPGYIGTGDLISSFGGGGVMFYLDEEANEIKFGGTSEAFNTYIKMMQIWYKKGWLDKKFAEHTSDIFYQVDMKTTHSGKAGMWYSNISSLFNRLEKEIAPATKGIYVVAARQPINDVYGEGKVKFSKDNIFTPKVFYNTSKEFSGGIFTTAFKETGKDIECLMSVLNFLNEWETEDGSLPGYLLNFAGLTKEQYETVAKPGDMYDRFGLTEGSYFVKEDYSDNGIKYKTNPIIGSNDALRNPSTLNRIVGGLQGPLDKWKGEEDHQVQHEWGFYINSGYLLRSFEGQLGSNISKKRNSTFNDIEEYLEQHVPMMIKGDDATFDREWANIKKYINRLEYLEEVLEVYNQLLNDLS